MCDWYEWEFELSHWNPSQSGIRFGFAKIPFQETIKNWNEGLGRE